MKQISKLEEQTLSSIISFYNLIRKVFLQLNSRKEIIALLIILKITLISCQAQVDSSQLGELKKLVSDLDSKIDKLNTKLDEVIQNPKQDKKKLDIVGYIYLKKSCLIKMYDSKKAQLENAGIDKKNIDKLSEKARYKYILIDSVRITVGANKIVGITVFYDDNIISHKESKDFSDINREYYFDLATSNEKINLTEFISYASVDAEAEINETLIKLVPGEKIELTKKR